MQKILKNNVVEETLYAVDHEDDVVLLGKLDWVEVGSNHSHQMF